MGNDHMKKTKMAMLLSALLISGVASADLTTGLVAYYPFDDCNAKDNSDNGNDGTLNGNAQCVSGIKGKALSFNGSTDYVYVPHSESLNITEQISFGAWVNLRNVTGFADNDIILNKEGIPYELAIHDNSGSVTCFPDSIPTYNFSFYINAGHESHQCGWANGGKAVQKNVWTFLFITYDGNQIKTYFDGKLVSTYYAGGYINTTYEPLLIGARGGSGIAGAFFNGLIDEVRIYNRALTDTEVTDLYNSGGKVIDKENILGSLCGITNKTHQTDMLKLMEVDMTNSIIFPSSIEAVSNYRNLLIQKDVANKTSRQLYNKISYLKNKNNQLISKSIGSFTAKDGKAAWSNFLKSAEVSDSLNKLSVDKKIAKHGYNILTAKLKKTPATLIHKAGTVTSGLLSVYGTACGLYEMYEDASNIMDGGDLAYDTLNLSWHAINVAGGSLSLWELATNIPNVTSKTLSRSAAFLLVPQVVALGYEWARDNVLYEEVDNIINTHTTTLEFRYSIVNEIVNELAKFRTTTPLDDLRGGIITILGKYPNVYKLDGTLFDADNEFIKYLDNVAFLQKQFGKSKYEELTPPELASVAAIYVLGEAASWENSILRTTMINNLTKMPVWGKPYTWGDILPAAFSGKDSFIVFSNLRSQVVNSLNYDVYDDLRTKFDNSFVKQRISIERQIGENIHYYEQP